MIKQPDHKLAALGLNSGSATMNTGKKTHI